MKGRWGKKEYLLWGEVFGGRGRAILQEVRILLITIIGLEQKSFFRKREDLAPGPSEECRRA